MRVIDRVGRAEARITDPFRRLRSRGRIRDRRNVRAHYDLSNDFFALMLDETMTYSCALFEDASASLADAQRSKLDRICRLLDLQPHDHVVEIGTGWGGFAIHAASNYGCRVTTTTISSAQFDLARSRVAAAGLEDLVTVRPDDYRDLRGSFTKLASIEMIEAVDWRDHDAFFATCSRLLEPDGLMALQAIVIDDNAFDRSKHTRTSSSASCSPVVAFPPWSRSCGRRRAATSGLSSCATSARTTPRRSVVGGRERRRAPRRVSARSVSTTSRGCGCSTSATAKRRSSSGA